MSGEKEGLRPEEEAKKGGLFGDLYKGVKIKKGAEVAKKRSDAQEQRRLADMFKQASGPFDRFKGEPLRGLSEAEALLSFLGFSVDSNHVVTEQEPGTFLKGSEFVMEAFRGAQEAVKGSEVLPMVADLVELRGQYEQAKRDLAGQVNEEVITERFVSNDVVREKSRYVVERLKAIAADVYGQAGEAAQERADEAFLETDVAQAALDSFPQLGERHEATEPTPELATFVYKRKLLEKMCEVDFGKMKRLKDIISKTKESPNGSNSDLYDAHYSLEKEQLKLQAGIFVVDRLMKKLDGLAEGLSDEEKIAFFENAPLGALMHGRVVDPTFGGKYYNVELRVEDSKVVENFSDEQKREFLIELAKARVLAEVARLSDHDSLLSEEGGVGSKKITPNLESLKDLARLLKRISDGKEDYGVKEVNQHSILSVATDKMIAWSPSLEEVFTMIHGADPEFFAEYMALIQVRERNNNHFHNMYRDRQGSKYISGIMGGKVEDRALTTAIQKRGNVYRSADGILYKERGDVSKIKGHIKSLEANKPEQLAREFGDRQPILSAEQGAQVAEHMRVEALRAVAEARQEADAIKASVEERDLQIEKLQAALAEIKSKIKQAQKEAQAAQKDVLHAGENIQVLHDNLDILNKEKSELVGKLAKAKVDEKSRIREREAKFAKLLSDIEDLKPSFTGGATKTAILELIGMYRGE